MDSRIWRKDDRNNRHSEKFFVSIFSRGLDWRSHLLFPDLMENSFGSSRKVSIGRPAIQKHPFASFKGIQNVFVCVIQSAIVGIFTSHAIITNENFVDLQSVESVVRCELGPMHFSNTVLFRMFHSFGVWSG